MTQTDSPCAFSSGIRHIGGLPISTPPITSYQQIALPLAVAMQNPTDENWLCSNYIQVFLQYDDGRKHDVVFMTVLRGEWEKQGVRLGYGYDVYGIEPSHGIKAGDVFGYL